MSHPTCFISYSWDNDAHKDWVRKLAEKLQDNGIIVSLDQWDIHAGADLTQYMETSVRDSKYVLLICTPKFTSKANLGKGGVGYEKMIVTGEIFQGVSSPIKFVPILKEGTAQDALPSYLKSKSFIDFRDSNDFDTKLEELLRHMHASPKHIRPPLGAKPALNPVVTAKQVTHPAPNSTKIIAVYCSRCGAAPIVKPSSCTGAYSNHNFIPSTGKVHCSRCGVVPGSKTTCSGAFSNHAFVPSNGHEFCSRCGTIPGSQSTCSGAYSNHNFIPSTGQVYCSRCGTVPGSKTTCTGAFSNHDFIRI